MSIVLRRTGPFFWDPLRNMARRLLIPRTMNANETQPGNEIPPEATMFRTALIIIVLLFVGFFVAPKIMALELNKPRVERDRTWNETTQILDLDAPRSLDGVSAIRGEVDECGVVHWRYER